MKSLILLAVLAVAFGVYAKEEGLFYRAGVVGSCAIVQTPHRDEGQWWSCNQGILTGYPSLTRDNCDRKGTTGERELWRCPYPLPEAPTY